MRAVHNQRELKLNNLAMILDSLKRTSPTVKSSLAREVGLSVVTVGKICDDLASAGIVAYTAERESTGGRRPVGIQLLPDSRYIFVLDLSMKECGYLGVLDLDFNEHAHHEFHIPTDWDMDRFLHAIKTHVAEVGAGIAPETVIGMCVAIPAIFNPVNGIVEECNNPLFLNHNLAAELATVFEHPIVVENDANLAALGYYRMHRIKNTLYLHFTKGIGLGILSDGRIFRGYAGYAGEVATMGVPGFRGEWCTAEQAVSTDYLQGAIREIATTTEGLSVVEALNSASSDLDPLRNYVATTIGRVLAVLIDLFNPEQVVLGGPRFGWFEHLLRDIRRTVDERSMTTQRVSVQIKSVTKNQNLVITGSCERLYQEWIRTAEIIS